MAAVELATAADPARGLTVLRQLAADQRSAQFVLETRSTADGICNLLGGAPAAVQQASQLIGQLIPGTTAAPVKRTILSDVTAAGLRASTRHRSLRVDEPFFAVRVAGCSLAQSPAGRAAHRPSCPWPAAHSIGRRHQQSVIGRCAVVGCRLARQRQDH